MVASSGFLTHGYRPLQGIPSKTNGSLIRGVTATSPSVATTGSSNHLIGQTSLAYANGTYLNQSYPIATLILPGGRSYPIFRFPKHINVAKIPAKYLLPVKQAAASLTDDPRLTQLSQASAPNPRPAQSETADSNPQPATVQQQDDPNTQAVFLPGSNNHGSASSAYILLSSSTFFLPQITTEPAPVVAGKPLVDAGGGNFQVNDQTISRGGATANIEGTPVYVNPQGAPVVGSQTYPLGPTAATSTIGTHTVIVNTAGIVFDGEQIGTSAAPENTGDAQVPFQSSSVTPGPAGDSVQSQNEAPLPSILNLAGGQSLTQLPKNPNAYLVSGTTLLPGLPAAIISGTSYSLAPSGALIIGTSTIPLATAGNNAATGILTAGRKVFTPLGSTAVAINGATLSLNGPGTTDHGTILSLGTEGLVVGSSTYAFATPAAAPNAAAATQQFPLTTVLSAAGQAFTTNPLGFSIAGTTIAPGSPGITIAGTRISLGASGILDIGSSTVNLSPTALTVAGQIFTPEPTAFSIAGTTLTAGGPGITISGTLISLGTSGALDIGGNTIHLPSPTAYTIAGQTFTPNPTAFSIASTTITAGGPGVTISGTPILLQPDGELVIGSSTIPLSAYTIADQTFTPNPTAFSIDGTTLTAGGPGLNINGTSILLEAGGKLVIGGSTFSLPASNFASVTSRADLTASSIDASGSSSSTIAPGGGSTSAIVGGDAGATRTGSKVHHGGAVGMRCGRFWWEVVGFIGFWMMMMLTMKV